MTSTTIKSITNIVYNNGLELYKKTYDTLFNHYSFKKNVTYRRYVFSEDNLSGDKSPFSLLIDKLLSLSLDLNRSNAKP